MHFPFKSIYFFQILTATILTIVSLSQLVLSQNSKVKFHPETNLDLNRILVIQDNLTGLKETNYFGLTVSLAVGPNPIKSGTTGWIFIGAPKSNLTLGTAQYNEPGQVWRCRLGQYQSKDEVCQTLPLASALCTEKEGPKEMRSCNNSFLGGSMTFANDFLLSCAPTWNKYRGNPTTGHKFNRMEGSCFWLTKNEAVDIKLRSDQIEARSRKLEPFRGNSGEHPFNRGTDPLKLAKSEVSRWFYGEAGFSSHITSSGDMVIGTPGIVGWKGGLYLFDPKSQNAREHILSMEFYVERPKHEDEFEYFGYAITSGKFLDSTLLIAASSPKGSYRTKQDLVQEVVGSVFLVTSSDFQLIKRGGGLDNKKTWKEVAVIRGDQFGSYFGASLESVNMDSDPLDELLVGAPFYQTEMSNDGDVGCVFAYSLNRGNQKFGENPLKMEGKIVGGRFGSSIAKLGDINQDGFGDVAIGAPFENNVGAVYIFYGSPSGIIPSNFFRIEAERFRGNLVKFSGFGYAISGGVDIDDNGIPDFTVGSYRSKNSVIFRTRPRMQVHSNTSFYVNNNNRILTRALILPRQTAEFQIRLCPSIWISTFLNRSMETIILANVAVDSRFLITLKQLADDESVNRTAPSNFILIPIRIPPETNSSCATLAITRIPTVEQDSNSKDEDDSDVIVKQRYSYVKTSGNSSLFALYSIQEGNRRGQRANVQITNSNFSDFCPSCPYPTFNETIDKISFESDCKSQMTFNATVDDQDLLCKPHLILIVGVKGGIESTNLNIPLQNNTTLTLGQIPWLLLNVTVENKNQTAHFPRILLKWKWVESKSSNNSTLTRKTKLPEFDSLPGCKARQNLIGEMEADCPLDRHRSRLKTNATKSLNFRFTTNPVIATHPKGLTLEIGTNVYLQHVTNSQSVSQLFRINYQTKNVSVKLIYTSVTQNVTGMASELFFVFKGIFEGVTPVDAALRFLIPTKVVVNGRLQDIISLQPPRIDGIPCSNGSQKIDPRSLHRSDEIKTVERNIEVLKLNAREKSGLSQSIDVVNCLDPKDQANCLQFKCDFSHQRKSPEQFQLEFKAFMDTKTADLLIKDKTESTILLVAYGEAQIFDGTAPKNINYHSETFAVMRFNLNRSKAIPIWIYAASAAGGLILFILIILGLSRYGFFARNTKQRLEELKAKAEIEDALEVQSRYQDQSASTVPSGSESQSELLIES